jgi:hypothetical protein
MAGVVPRRIRGFRIAAVLFASQAFTACTELGGVRYELRPSVNGDSLHVTTFLAFREPPARLTLTGRASVEVEELRDPRAFDDRGHPIPVRAGQILHETGERTTALPALEIAAPIPRRLRVEYWLVPAVRDGSEHMGFHGKAFGIGSKGLVFVVGRNVLLLPEPSIESALVEVVAALPPGWTAATPWASRGGRLVPGVEGEYADEDLVSAPIAMGCLARSEFAVGPTHYEVAFPADTPADERRRTLERMREIAQFVDSTLGFHLGARYTVVAAPTTSDGDDVEGTAWGTGQGGTLVPLTPRRALVFARRLTESHVRHLPYRRPLSQSQDFWVIDALEQSLPWRALARIGLADEEQVRSYYAAEYLTSLQMSGVDPNLETIYEGGERRKTEREVIAPFVLGLWEHGAGRESPIDWPAVFRAGRLRAGFGAGRAVSDWESFRRRFVQGRQRAPAEEMLDRLALDSLPRDAAPSRRQLTIAFTSNTEGYLENCGCKTNQSGGLARRATVLDSLREADPVMILDAGSAFARPDKRGRLDDLGRQEERLYLGVVKRMSYDAIAIGETELGGGPEHFARLASDLQLPYLGANVRCSNGAIAPGWKRVKVRGLTVGVVGAFDPPTGPDANDAFYDAIGDTRFTEPAGAVVAAIDSMGPVDLVVVMGRLSPAAMRRIVAAAPRVDVLISSESPSSMGNHLGVAVTNVAAGRLGRTILVMSQLSRYGVGVLRLDLDDSLCIRGAEVRPLMLDESVRDSPGVRGELTAFYDRIGRSTGSQWSVAALFPDDRDRQTARYAGASACANCHRAEYEQWLTTPHASAYRTLLNVHRHYNPRCVVCHVVGFGTDHGFRLGSASEALAGVQCEVCHGPGAGHAARPSLRNVRRAVSESLCVSCHNPEHSEAFIFAERLPRVVHVSVPASGMASSTAR